ncbi:phage head morphogenesis protein [Algicola sagamiensis]|uniref:phage head morphogenesis protein n=1 Tax=Algicola sagamiensis TaxID=163869 RepID=UPI0003A87602|nr:phage minor head protein [Algicola sagamiensis]
MKPIEALKYLLDKGYQLGWDHRDVWKEEHIRSFTVAKAMCKDILIDIRYSIDKALREGKPYAQFQKELVPLLARKGWIGKVLMSDGSLVELGTPRRLKIIFDTNVRVARSAGQWQRFEQRKKALPYLRYSLGPSKEHREEHVKFKGYVLPITDPFWNTHMPPNGWGCKCRARQISEAEALKYGVSESPKLEYQTWTNQRTGKTELVPEGVDPGWNYNPGKSKLEHTKQYAREKDLEFSAAFAGILEKLGLASTEEN